jgi:hypothetical protein
MEMEPCTFRPAVNDPLAEKRSYEGDVIDRLFRDNERNLWLIEQKREELLEAELSKLKPRPTIPETSIELAERKRKEGSPYGSSTHYVQVCFRPRVCLLLPPPPPPPWILVAFVTSCARLLV